MPGPGNAWLSLGTVANVVIERLQSKKMDWRRMRRLVRLGLAECVSKLRLLMDKIDSQSAIHIPADLPLDQLQERIAALPRLNFIHLDHAEIARTDDDHIITLARQEPGLHANLVAMANAGFHLYVLRNGVSSMVRHRRIPTLWNLTLSGEVSVDENGIFSKLEPATGSGDPRLLVVFSSIAAKMYTPGLMRHFEQNFATIGKYIPKNTHILRIPDFGGVVGSFYLNSLALPRNEDNIAGRIAAVAAQLGVSDDGIVLYGGSKGGTAAAYYAMRQGWRGIAVDPILSDDHYVRKYRDLHFTQGTFAATKQERFGALVQQVHPKAQLSVICSTRSPQLPYIQDILIDRFRDRFLFLNSENPEIKSHPDVGRVTIPHALSQINAHLAGLPVTGGYHTVW